MSLAIVSQDLAAHLAALLPLAKTHMRVDWAYDDDFIKSVIGRAIARFEQTNEVTINPTVVEWRTGTTDFSDGAATLPVRPVSGFTATDTGEPPLDVSTEYTIALKWDSIHGVPIQVLEGASAALVAQLTCGYATAANIPPAVEDAIMRHTAHLFEHREILIPGQEYVAPDLRLDASWWMPRV